MSSLKDIMDVDVEPFESQAYRRSKEAAQQQATRPPIASSSQTRSPSVEEDDNHKGKAPVKRRRSNRVPKPTTPPTASRSNVARRRSSASGEAMDFTPTYQASGSNQASSSGTSQPGVRASESGTDIPVKYTPVTGRISRAKKGVPVHTCEVCRPAKTFTRAEHLRRHQLSHQKPAYACTFEDCERAFHRPDLLARHMHRHETQGEKPYRAGDRSRASSSASESRPPSLKVETPSQGLVLSQISPTDSATPKTAASGDSSMTATSSGTIVPNFQPVNFSTGSLASSQKRTAAQAQLSGSGSYPAASSESRSSGGFDQLSSDSFVDLPGHNNFARQTSGFGDLNFDNDAQFQNYTTSPQSQLPLLRIPEENIMPSLSYTQENSPWCSSASDSSYYSDGSRSSRPWPRARSGSLAEWPVSTGPTQWSPHGLVTTPQDLRSTSFDPSTFDQFDTTFTSPRMTPPSSRTNQLLDVPNSFGGFYNMDSVGTPTLSASSRSNAQITSASASRVSDTGLAGVTATRSKTQLARLGAVTSMASNYHAKTKVDLYVKSYWQHFHPIFPIIHRPTFEISEDNLLLTPAVAAIGSQYHRGPEARTIGYRLNEHCRKSIDLCTTWNLQIMQAILLTEFFTLFRGRKTIVRVSSQFESLYRRLLQNLDQDIQPFSGKPNHGPLADPTPERLATQSSDQTRENQGLQQEWLQWADDEARRRLLIGCFIIDVHQALYHQQPRGCLESVQSLFPCLKVLWDASTASEWKAQYSRSDSAPQPLRQNDESSSASDARSDTFLSRSLLIASLATRLPSREDVGNSNGSQHDHPGVAMLMELFPSTAIAQTYLALNHTPLHALLAIAGDTWIFGKKITPISAFNEALEQLKKWSTSPAAAQATLHACRVLSLKLNYQTNRTNFLTDYWSEYVSVLICWAFGHRFQAAAGGSGSISRNSSDGDLKAMDADKASDEARRRASIYLDGMLALSVDSLLSNSNSIKALKGETSGVIAVIRQRLTVESVGSTCGMLVDCVGVLNKISKIGKGKWF